MRIAHLTLRGTSHGACPALLGAANVTTPGTAGAIATRSTALSASMASGDRTLAEANRATAIGAGAAASPTMVSMRVIDSRHTAISSWSRAAPDKNIFLSIVGLSYANKSAPNGAAVIFAAPLGPGRCQGGTVQVYPVAQSCSALQAKLIRHGHTIAVLRALPVVESRSGIRYVLIPTAGDGCTLVAVGLHR